MEARPKKIEFHYIKSHYFESYLAHGVYGGVGPGGLINFAFYSERSPIPTKAVWSITGNGEMGDEIVAERESKVGVIRDVHCNIMVDLNTAKKIKEWLSQHIQVLESLQEETLKKKK